MDTKIKFYMILISCLWEIGMPFVEAQEILVESCEMLSGREAIIKYPRKDLNGITCALIKVKTENLSGLHFPNHNQYIGEIEYTNGTYYIYVPESSYRITYQHPNYHSGEINMRDVANLKAQSGKVYRIILKTLDTDVATTIPIEATQEVEVRCNVSKAHIYVDNVDYGKVGVLNMPLGEHTIRFSAKGYVDCTNTIFITENTKILLCELKKNKGVEKSIHAVDVKIYSNSYNLYKNNKRIPNWRSGAIVKFIPGKKCYLSDDSGKGCFFQAENRSMTIRFYGSSYEEKYE